MGMIACPENWNAGFSNLEMSFSCHRLSVFYQCLESQPRWRLGELFPGLDAVLRSQYGGSPRGVGYGIHNVRTGIEATLVDMSGMQPYAIAYQLPA